MRIFRLLYSATVLKLLFGLKAFKTHGRGTHLIGVGSTGRLKVVDQPNFPTHEFFRPGREFTVALRHSNLEFPDDATLDIRGCALKLSDKDGSQMDLVMNTGTTAVFWNVPSFIDFVKGKKGGKEGQRLLLERSPLAYTAAISGLRRKPSSFTGLHYYTQVVFNFSAKDSAVRYVRYRVIPADGRPEDGLPTPVDFEKPWDQERFEGVSVPTDYLRQEFRDRLAHEKVSYRLQLQLHTASPDDPPEVFHAGLTWDEATHPWLDLAEITLDRSLTDPETERLRFNIDNQPKSLGVLPASSLDDYNSINYVRVKIYRLSQLARRLSRKKVSSESNY